jgi:subtilisin family serine protease
MTKMITFRALLWFLCFPSLIPLLVCRSVHAIQPRFFQVSSTPTPSVQDGDGAGEQRGPVCKPDQLIVKFINPKSKGFTAAGQQRFAALLGRWKLNDSSFKKMYPFGVDLRTAQVPESLREGHAKGEKLYASLLSRFPQRAARGTSNGAFAGLTSTFLVTFSKGADLAVAATELYGSGLVEYVNGDCEVSTSQSESQNSTENELWGMNRISAPAAWESSTGKGIVVAVLDTGVDVAHPDLAENIWTNPGEIPDNCIDDDNNGYIDDTHGYSFSEQWSDVNSNCSSREIVSPYTVDKVGHGTHVAGTIAARAKNGIGVFGVAPEAMIMPLKGLRDNGRGSLSDLVRGLIYAGTSGADVINNSWGIDGNVRTPEAEDALAALNDLGVVAVFAAGNSSLQIGAQSFIAKDLSINVGAIDQRDELARFSNFGSSVTVVAPGVDILSTWSRDSLDDPSEYKSINGTSMAAPHVSGVVALMLATNPRLTLSGARNILSNSSQDLGIPGVDPKFGFGVVNALSAVQMAKQSVGREALMNTSVKIESPQHNSMFSAQGNSRLLPIRGKFKGAGLTNVRVFLAKSLNNWYEPTSVTWSPIPTLESWKTSGLAAQLNVDSLAPGRYLVKLEATDSSGQRLSHIATFFVDLPGITTVEFIPYVGVWGETFMGHFKYKMPGRIGVQKLVLEQDGRAHREFTVYDINNKTKNTLPLPSEIDRRYIEAFGKAGVLYYQEAYFSWDTGEWEPKKPGYYQYDLIKKQSALVQSCVSDKGAATFHCLARAQMTDDGQIVVGSRDIGSTFEVVALNVGGDERILMRQSENLRLKGARLVNDRYVYVLSEDLSKKEFSVQEFDLLKNTPPRTVYNAPRLFNGFANEPYLPPFNQETLIIDAPNGPQSVSDGSKRDLFRVIPGRTAVTKIFSADMFYGVHITGAALSYLVWSFDPKNFGFFLKARDVTTGSEQTVTLRDADKITESLSTGRGVVWAEESDEQLGYVIRTSSLPNIYRPTPAPTFAAPSH